MTHLKVGDQAPKINVIIEDGSNFTLDSIQNKKKILFFYPKDNTPGCTANACNFRDNYEDLTKKGFEIIGVSIQGTSSHQKFIAKNNLPFHLIVDEDKKMHNDYGVWGLKKLYGREYMGCFRTTFILDEDNVILHIITKVKTKDATNQILELLN